MSFLDNYQPVEERIRLFWLKWPEGRIHTEIVLINEQEIVIKASIYTNRDDARPAAIDFAQETRGSSNINRTSFVENCATSAIGRGLATLGFAPKGARPSREEMKKAVAEKPQIVNYSDLAEMIYQTGDVKALQETYKQAKAAGVTEEVLKEIADKGTKLKEKGSSTQKN